MEALFLKGHATLKFCWFPIESTEAAFAVLPRNVSPYVECWFRRKAVSCAFFLKMAVFWCLKTELVKKIMESYIINHILAISSVCRGEKASLTKYKWDVLCWCLLFQQAVSTSSFLWECCLGKASMFCTFLQWH